MMILPRTLLLLGLAACTAGCGKETPLTPANDPASMQKMEEEQKAIIAAESEHMKQQAK